MAGMRLSGMISGMDTESLISQLVEGRKKKVDKVKKQQIKVNWKQDAWKDLNKKLKNLQSKYISNMRFTTAYTKKTTKVSNPNAASVITGEGAVNGVQSLEITKMAKTAYLTGAELKNGNQKADYNALTKLGEMGIGETESGSFSVKTAGKTFDIQVDANTTISDVLNKMKEAGLNASFDAKNQRFFISAKESGENNDFSITASDGIGAKALTAMGLQVNLNEDKASLAQYRELAGYMGADKDATLDNLTTLIQNAADKKADAYLDIYKKAQAGLKTAEGQLKTLREKYGLAEDGDLSTVLDQTSEEYSSALETKKTDLENLRKAKEDGILTPEELNRYDSDVEALESEINGLSEKMVDAKAMETAEANKTECNSQITDALKYINVEPQGTGDDITYTATASSLLLKQEGDALYDKVSYAASVIAAHREDDDTKTGATKVSGQDAKISLNGAEFTSSSNVFEINGLTITALAETKEGESITLTTQNDNDGIYDMVKNFLKEYNSIINEMDKLYNADAAKGYEPLLSEEKDAMSETEVTEYEKKIKEGLLHGDSNLSSIRDGIKSVMASGFNVGGKMMYLSSFGINTLGYFNAADNEKNAYHIDGDPDDENTSGNVDRLKSMISSDPDSVISFFTQLSRSLYDKMSNLSSSVEGYRSFGSFYDDKKMKSDYDSYNSKIKDMEQKLNDYEDKWYSKFAKMETTMAKMQKNTSALSGLLGGM